MPYPIYDNPISTTLVGFLVLVPDNEWLIKITQGAIAELINPAIFQQEGTATPEEIANIFEDITLRLFLPTIDEIATIKYSASPTPSFGLLPCDGSSHLREDYPRLYENIDPFYHVDADTFTTPDLNGRVIVASGTGSGLTVRSIGESFGEEAHSLNSDENAPHEHLYNSPVTAPALEGAGVPLPTGLTVVPANTGNSGLGTPHENMQPSHVLYCYIVAI